RSSELVPCSLALTSSFFSPPPLPPRPPLFPYTTLFRSPRDRRADRLRGAHRGLGRAGARARRDERRQQGGRGDGERTRDGRAPRSEEHTSELQSHLNLVCRLLLEKKKNKKNRQ